MYVMCVSFTLCNLQVSVGLSDGNIHVFKGQEIGFIESWKWDR